MDAAIWRDDLNECTAANCGKELAAGITLCHDHTTLLEQALADVPAVWADLRTTMARMDRAASAEGGGNAHQGSRPPVNLDALDQAHALRVVLGRWCAQLPALRPVRAEPPALAALLTEHMAVVRGAEWSATLLAELHACLRECRFATDRAADLITIGTCGAFLDDDTECGGTLRAPAGARLARCRECGGTLDVRERQAWAISEAWNATAPMPVLIRALKAYGITVKPGDAKNWAKRGKLLACVHPDGSRTYQLAALRRVQREMDEKRHRRTGCDELPHAA